MQPVAAGATDRHAHVDGVERRQLRGALAARPAETREAPAAEPPETHTLEALATTLERHLASEARRRATVERQLQEARQAAAYSAGATSFLGWLAGDQAGGASGSNPHDISAA
jgi:hypothetical protein